MANGWTPERRARQAALIQKWRPWQRSTRPKTQEGKMRAAKNAYKGGHWKTLRELARALKRVEQTRRHFLKEKIPEAR